MKRIARNTVIMVAALVVVGTVWAAQPVSEKLPIGPGGEIDIEVLSGTVTIEAWDKDMVEVTGTLGDGVEELEIDGDEDGVWVEVVFDEEYHGRHEVETDLTIRLPGGAPLSVETVSASISVMGVTGELDIETVSGNIQVSSKPAALDVESVSGNIFVESAPPESDVASVSGLIEIRAAGGYRWRGPDVGFGRYHLPRHSRSGRRPRRRDHGWDDHPGGRLEPCRVVRALHVLWGNRKSDRT
jgi:hypothetical protein